jgi:hypothetical protein
MIGTGLTSRAAKRHPRYLRRSTLQLRRNWAQALLQPGARFTRSALTLALNLPTTPVGK